jgi:hypothetical protein
MSDWHNLQWNYFTAKYKSDRGYILPIRIPTEFITASNPQTTGDVMASQMILWRHLGRKHGLYARGYSLAFDIDVDDNGKACKFSRYLFYPILMPEFFKLPIFKERQLNLNGLEWRIVGQRNEQFRGGLNSYKKFCTPLKAKGIPVDIAGWSPLF